MNEEMIQRLLQEATPLILEGAAPEVAIAIAAGFKSLLRIVPGKDQSCIPDPEAMDLRMGRRIMEKISAVAPENRLEHIQNEYDML